MHSPYQAFLREKQASGADAALAATHFAQGMGHVGRAAKARISNAAHFHVEDMKSRITNAVADRMAADARPHMRELITPQGVAQTLQQPGMQDLVHKQVSTVANQHVGQALDMFNPFAKKRASLDPMLAGGLAGAALGAANSYIFPTHVHGKERTEYETQRDLAIGAGVGGGIGAAIAPGLASGVFHRQAAIEHAGKDVGSVVGAFSRAARAFSKAASLQPPMPAGLPYDPKLHADIVKAKGAYNKSRLRYMQSFRKLPKEAQGEILKKFDAYQKSIQQAVATGNYAGPF